MLPGQVPRQGADETGKPFRLANLAATDFFERQAESVLGEIVNNRCSGTRSVQDDSNATTIAMDQLLLGLPVTLLDSADKVLRGPDIIPGKSRGAHRQSP